MLPTLCSITLNKSGSIHEEVDLIMNYKNHTEKATFAVCDLGIKLLLLDILGSIYTILMLTGSQVMFNLLDVHLIAIWK